MKNDLPFAEGKKSTKLWLAAKPPKDYRWPCPPDRNIAPLIRALNTLPFLSTLYSCGGHIRTKKEVFELLAGGANATNMAKDDTFGAYSGAWLSFTTDGSAESVRFVRALKKMVGAWKDALFMKLSTGDHTFVVNITGAENGKPAKSFRGAQVLDKEAADRMEQIVALIRRHKR